jgi:hypothetical protein
LRFGVGLVPSVLALSLWKARGEGHVPILSHAEPIRRLALGGLEPLVGIGGLNVHRYLSPDWGYFTSQLDGLREHFWSARVLEWIALAGLIGLFRRSRPAGFLFGGWFFATVFVKWTSSSHGATIDNSDLLRQTISTIPAALLLIAGILLLFPGVPQRLRAPEKRPWGSHRLRLGLAAAVIGVFGVAPLALAATLTPLPRKQTLEYYTQITTNTGLSAPFGVDGAWRAAISRDGQRLRVTWPRLHPLGGTMGYLVIRAPANDWLYCDVTGGGSQCRLLGSVIAATKGTSIVDRPPPGTWVYRVAAVASWIAEPTAGDIYVVGRPVRVTVPG